MKVIKENIFNFSDYREFLLSHYDHEKERWSDFSYNVWARKLRLKNNTSIIKIIKGQRNAGEDITAKFCHYFNFNEKEKEYFEGLIKLDKVKDDNKLRVMLMQDLQKLNHKNNQILINEQKFKTISSLWTFTFRQLAKIGYMTDDASALQKRLLTKLPLRRINSMIKNLLELNLLSKDEAGFHCVQNSINTSDDVSSEALKQFHEEALDLGKRAIREIDPQNREISGLTFAFDQKDTVAAKDMIRDFQDQFVARFGAKESSTHIYQMQTQFFPLTKKLNNGDCSEDSTIH